MFLEKTLSAGEQAPSVHTDIEADPGVTDCGLVHVSATFTIDDAYLTNHYEDKDLEFALGFFGEMKQPRNLKVTLNDRPYLSIYNRSGEPTKEVYPSLALRQDVNFNSEPEVSYGATTPRVYYGYSGSVTNWPKHRADLLVEFDADWSRLLSLGSCAFSTPQLVDTRNAFLSATLASKDLTSDSDVAAQSGQVDVWASRRLIRVDGEDLRSAAVGNYRRFCSPLTQGETFDRQNNDCSTLLVVDVSNKDLMSLAVAVIAGGLISLSLQIFWEVLGPRKT